MGNQSCDNQPQTRELYGVVIYEFCQVANKEDDGSQND